MGLSFRKSFKLSSGTKLNFGKKNVSVSFGGKGLSINTGTRGTFLNVGIPGTGISYRSKLFKKKKHRKIKQISANINQKYTALDGAVMLGFIVGAIVFLLSNSFLLSVVPLVLFIFLYVLSVKNSQSNIEIKNKNIITNIHYPIHIKIEASNHKVIPVQQFIGTLYPNVYGLYPHEILALALYPKLELNGDPYPKYWWDTYGVKDVNKLLISLKNRGFYKTPTTLSMEEALQRYKVIELREIIKNYKLKIPKRKADMIKIIIDNLPKEDLEKIISKLPNDYFIISDFGKKAIQNDEYVLYAHRYEYDEFNVYSLNMRMKGDTLNYRKHIWQIFSEKAKQCINHNDYAKYSIIRFHMSEFLADENNFFDAIRVLAEVIYIDLSGITPGPYPGENTEYFLYDNEFYISPNSLPSGVIGKLCEYQEKVQINDEKLSQILTECFSKISLPFHLFTISECTQITLCSIKNENEKVHEIYKQAQQRLQKQYPELNITLGS